MAHRHISPANLLAGRYYFRGVFQQAVRNLLDRWRVHDKLAEPIGVTHVGAPAHTAEPL
jgi:hypothetical protein